MKPVDELAKIHRTASDILRGVVRVRDPERLRGPRHELHQACRARARRGLRIKARLGANDCGDQRRVDTCGSGGAPHERLQIVGNERSKATSRRGHGPRFRRSRDELRAPGVPDFGDTTLHGEHVQCDAHARDRTALASVARSACVSASVAGPR